MIVICFRMCEHIHWFALTKKICAPISLFFLSTAKRFVTENRVQMFQMTKNKRDYCFEENIWNFSAEHLSRFRSIFNIKSGHKLWVRKNTVGRIEVIWLVNLSTHFVLEVGDELSGNIESKEKHNNYWQQASANKATRAHLLCAKKLKKVLIINIGDFFEAF